MKFIIPLLFLVFLTCCNQQDSKKKAETTTIITKDSAADNPAATEEKDNTAKQAKPATADSVQLQQLSRDILATIKSKDFKKLSQFVHPAGVRFSVYAYIDTVKDKRFTPAQLAEFGSKPTKFTWGLTDGEGKPIVLSLDKYVDRWAYDKDYLNAPQSATNRFLGYGNSLNNLLEAYPGADFTEFYFPGFEPKYEGMDWRTIRLVFRKEDNKYYLVGIVHDEWTI